MNFEIIVTKFLEYGGILAPIVIFLGWYVFKMHTRLEILYKERLNDANKVTDKLISLHEKAHSAITQVNASIAVNSELLGEVVEILENNLEQETKRRRGR